MAKIKQGQKTNSDPQNATPKTEDWIPRLPLKPGMNSSAPEK